MTTRSVKFAASLAAILAYATIAILPISSTRTDVAQEGRRAWTRGEFEIAARHFERDKSDNWATKQYNRGTALVSAALKSPNPDKLRQAVETLGQAAYQGDPSLRAAALYNAGSAQLLAGKADKAIPLLRGAILADPDLLDAKVNLSLALRIAFEERKRKAQAGHTGEQNEATSAEPDASSNSGSRQDSSGAISKSGEQRGESEGEGANETSLANAGRAGVTSPSEESGTESNIGPSPRALSSKEMGLTQKLDALQRRSSELRRAGLLKKSSDRKARMREDPDQR